jgi:hypothetical protein
MKKHLKNPYNYLFLILGINLGYKLCRIYFSLDLHLNTIQDVEVFLP